MPASASSARIVARRGGACCSAGSCRIVPDSAIRPNRTKRIGQDGFDAPAEADLGDSAKTGGFGDSPEASLLGDPAACAQGARRESGGRIGPPRLIPKRDFVPGPPTTSPPSPPRMTCKGNAAAANACEAWAGDGCLRSGDWIASPDRGFPGPDPERLSIRKIAICACVCLQRSTFTMPRPAVRVHICLFITSGLDFSCVWRYGSSHQTEFTPSCHHPIRHWGNSALACWPFCPVSAAAVMAVCAEAAAAAAAVGFAATAAAVDGPAVVLAAAADATTAVVVPTSNPGRKPAAAAIVAVAASAHDTCRTISSDLRV